MAAPETLPVFAYYYPLTTDCPEQRQRASKYGVTLVNESELATKALSLFDGHDQPRTYCLGDSSTPTWDDADPAVMEKQVALASENGVDGFLFDTYIGEKQGRRLQEKAAPLDDAFLKSGAGDPMKFAVSVVSSSPRVVLPVPRDPSKWERDRFFDYSAGTAEAVVDASMEKYWERDNYIRMPGDRPYISVFGNFAVQQTLKDGDNSGWNIYDVVDHLKTYSEKKYKVVPYVAALCLGAETAHFMSGSSFDAVTGYALLSDFKQGAEPIQDYRDRLDVTVTEWPQIAKDSGLPFVPPVVAGWDPSPRGNLRPGRLEDMQWVHPFGPVVTGDTSEEFTRMLEEQARFVETNVPAGERYVPLCSWNEVTEGNAILPRIRPDGTIDDGYLRALHAFTSAARQG